MRTLFEEIQSNLEEINEGALSKLKAYGHKRLLKDIKRLSDAGVQNGDLVYSSKTLGKVYARLGSGSFGSEIKFASYAPWPNQIDEVVIYYPDPGTEYSWKDAEKEIAIVKKNQSKMISLLEAKYHESFRTSTVEEIALLEGAAIVVFDSAYIDELVVAIGFETGRMEVID